MPQRKIVLNMTQRKPPQKRQQKKKRVTPVGKLIRAAGGAAGTALGGYFGMPALAGAAGTQLGALASRWLGFGAYTVKQNTILRSTESIPSMHKFGQSIIVRHKEYIGPIKGSIAFKTQYSIPLNPALQGSFPWLSGVAQRYQEYAFKGVVFHYIPSSGAAVASTNAALGTVMIQTSYRASDSAPLDKVELLNEYCASESMPSESFIHPIECDPRENPFNIHYCRAVAPPPGEPLMSYDLGKTFVATQGQQVDDKVLGDLWVTYEVELKKPVVRTDVSSGGYYFAEFVPDSATDLFHTLESEVGTLDMGFSATNTIAFPETGANTYLVTIDSRGSNFSAYQWTGAATKTNATFLPINARGETYIATDVVSGSAQAAIAFIVRKTDATKEAIVSLTGLTYTGTHGFAEVSVFALTDLPPS